MSNFWDAFLLIAEAFVFIAYLFILFHIFADLFRNDEMRSIIKVIWTIGLLLPIPFVALVYIIRHGIGMTKRKRQAMEQVRLDSENYIRQIAGKSPAEQISEAKGLLDAGTINSDEFAQLKAKALA
jgi:hypothetical protein